MSKNVWEENISTPIYVWCNTASKSFAVTNFGVSYYLFDVKNGSSLQDMVIHIPFIHCVHKSQNLWCNSQSSWRLEVSLATSVLIQTVLNLSLATWPFWMELSPQSPSMDWQYFCKCFPPQCSPAMTFLWQFWIFVLTSDFKCFQVLGVWLKAWTCPCVRAWQVGCWWAVIIAFLVAVLFTEMPKILKISRWYCKRHFQSSPSSSPKLQKIKGRVLKNNWA